MALALQFLVELKVVIVTIILAALFIAEKLWPAAILIADLRSQKAQLRRWGKNFGFFLINALLAPLVVIPLSAWAEQLAFGWRGNALGIYSILFDLLILDVAIYWWHRLNHEIPFLWRFHQVHHLDQFLDTSSAVRFHFGEVLLSALFRMIVIIVANIPLSSVVLFEIALLVVTIFHHSNLRIATHLERILGWLMITPALHWVHHHAKRSDTDSNYGSVFSIWDRLFQTRSLTQRTPDMRIGVEGVREKNFAELIVSPFRPPPPRR